jgi:hypothetical protein
MMTKNKQRTDRKKKYSSTVDLDLALASTNTKITFIGTLKQSFF